MPQRQPLKPVEVGQMRSIYDGILANGKSGVFEVTFGPLFEAELNLISQSVVGPTYKRQMLTHVAAKAMVGFGISSPKYSAYLTPSEARSPKIYSLITLPIAGCR